MIWHGKVACTFEAVTGNLETRIGGHAGLFRTATQSFYPQMLHLLKSTFGGRVVL
jgi:hypothetical protein